VTPSERIDEQTGDGVTLQRAQSHAESAGIFAEALRLSTCAALHCASPRFVIWGEGAHNHGASRARAVTNGRTAPLYAGAATNAAHAFLLLFYFFWTDPTRNLILRMSTALCPSTGLAAANLRTKAQGPYRHGTAQLHLLLYMWFRVIARLFLITFFLLCILFPSPDSSYSLSRGSDTFLHASNNDL
jgi:hypothetical protein